MPEYKTPEECWDKFWKSILCPNGYIDLPQLRRELFDYYRVMKGASEVYCYITNNQVSKPLTEAHIVCALADEYSGSLYADDLALKDEAEALLEQLLPGWPESEDDKDVGNDHPAYAISYGDLRVIRKLLKKFDGDTTPEQKNLQEDLNSLRGRVEEIAIKHCESYPDIGKTSTLERLYAIECSLEGIQKANDDLHEVIKRLREKCGMTIEEFAAFLENK